MSEEVVIGRRFNGPPATAHGGYACARAAQFLDWSASVRLRMPPPLGHPLSVRRDDGSVMLLDGETVVMEATPADLQLDIPDPVSLAEAEAAAAACPWLEQHWFPTCFAGAVQASGTEAVHVLGRLTGQVLAPVEVGRPQTVIAWPIGVDGRKRYGGVAIFGDGELRAVGEALWIELIEPERFGATTTA